MPSKSREALVVRSALILTTAFAWPTNCTTDEINPCVKRCDAMSEPIDLSDFRNRADGHFIATDVDENDYYFDACGALRTAHCEDSSVRMPAALKAWAPAGSCVGRVKDESCSSLQRGSCAALGTFETQHCTFDHIQHRQFGTGSLKCKYTGGIDKSDVTIRYVCQSRFIPPMAAKDVKFPSYMITIAGPAACPKRRSKDET